MSNNVLNEVLACTAARSNIWSKVCNMQAITRVRVIAYQYWMKDHSQCSCKVTTYVCPYIVCRASDESWREQRLWLNTVQLISKLTLPCAEHACVSWYSRVLNTHVLFNFCQVTCVWNASDTQRSARVQYFVCCTRVRLCVLHARINSLIYIRGTLYMRIINYEMAKSTDTQKSIVKNTCTVQCGERNNHACKFKFIRIQLAKPRMIHTRAGFMRVSHILWRVRKSIARLVADYRSRGPTQFKILSPAPQITSKSICNSNHKSHQSISSFRKLS